MDCFAGSGTTGVVAANNGRIFLGIELNSQYVKLAEKRLEPYIGYEKAYLEKSSNQDNGYLTHILKNDASNVTPNDASNATPNDVYKLNRKGKSQRQIAKILNVNQTTVSRILKKTSQAHKRRSLIQDARRRRILELNQESKSQRQIAKIVGISVATVNRTLHKTSQEHKSKSPTQHDSQIEVKYYTTGSFTTKWHTDVGEVKLVVHKRSVEKVSSYQADFLSLANIVNTPDMVIITAVYITISS